MKESAKVQHSYGSYAPSTYGSYGPRKANPSTGANAVIFLHASPFSLRDYVHEVHAAGKWRPLPMARGRGRRTEDESLVGAV